MNGEQLDLFDQPESAAVRRARQIEAVEAVALRAIRQIVELSESGGCEPFGAATLAKVSMVLNNGIRRLWQEPTIIRTEVERRDR